MKDLSGRSHAHPMGEPNWLMGLRRNGYQPQTWPLRTLGELHITAMLSAQNGFDKVTTVPDMYSAVTVHAHLHRLSSRCQLVHTRSSCRHYYTKR
jgi:hypothetical protein